MATNDPWESPPLSGIRVIDLTTVYAGPTCTQILALLGADVIKVESINHNNSRGNYIFPGNDPGDQPWNRAGYFMKRNLGKRSISLELGTPQGRDLLKRLVAGAQVLVESYRPGVMEKFGLDYGALRTVRPDLIMLSMSGWGQTGPWRSYGAYGMGLDPAGGIAFLSGYRDRGPVRAGMAYLDPLSGLVGAAAVLTAIYHWQETGEGQHIDLAEAEVAPLLVADAVLEYTMTGRIRDRQGNGHRSMAPHGIYPSRGDQHDHWIAIACRDDRDWQRLRRIMGDPAWSRDARFSTAEGRCRHRDELDARLAAWTAGRDKFTLTEQLQAAGVPAGPVLTNRELLRDPHLRDRGFFAWWDQPPVGRYPFPRQLPVRFDGCYPCPPRPSPLFGEHNHEVLGGELGLTTAEIQALADAGVIGDRPAPRAPVPFDLEVALARRLVVASDAGHHETVAGEVAPGPG